MDNFASAAVESSEIQPGVTALPRAMVWLRNSRTLVAADVHFGYEDVIGGALPLWSTSETLAVLLNATRRYGARELVLLGDAIHGSRMSEGAARIVKAALAQIRDAVELSIVAGNHEGRSRGVAILGQTHEVLERDGWLLAHGDRPYAASKCIIGHLHPSLALGGGVTVPAFLSGAQLIVAPAMTPYSAGLDIFGEACAQALGAFVREPTALCVTASTEDRVYPFGELGLLRRTLRAPFVPHRFRRRVLRGTS